jgi:hypothetical protein
LTLAERSRTLRRGRTANVLRLLEPSALLAPGASALDEPHLARAIQLVQSHAPVGGAWTAEALGAAAQRAADALDDAHAAGAPAPGSTEVGNLPLPPLEPGELPDASASPVSADDPPPKLAFATAAAALAPLCACASVQLGLRQMHGALAAAVGEGEAAPAPRGLLAALADERALADTLATLAYGQHDARLQTLARLFADARTRAPTAAAASAAASADAGADGEAGLAVEESSRLVHALERAARPSTLALLRALDGALGDEDERPWADEWISAGKGRPPPVKARGWLSALRRAPPAERALTAHLAALASPSLVPLGPDGKRPAPLLSVDAFAASPPPRLASVPALLEATAKSLQTCALRVAPARARARAPEPACHRSQPALAHLTRPPCPTRVVCALPGVCLAYTLRVSCVRFSDEKRKRADARINNRYYAAAFVAAVTLDVTLSYI